MSHNNDDDRDRSECRACGGSGRVMRGAHECALCLGTGMRDECECCGAWCDRARQYVPGDRHAAFVCEECGTQWLRSHVWDDALGEWIEVAR